jgi:hypothetical protein
VIHTAFPIFPPSHDPNPIAKLKVLAPTTRWTQREIQVRDSEKSRRRKQIGNKTDK